jgi:hypothetical protein
MNKAYQIKLARDAYHAALMVVGDALLRAYDAAEDGERAHRGRGGEFRKYHPRATPIVTCAELCVVRWLARYASGTEAAPDLSQVHKMRRDVVLCASIAAEYGPALLAAWAQKRLDTAEIAALDYAAVVN